MCLSLDLSLKLRPKKNEKGGNLAHAHVITIHSFVRKVAAVMDDDAVPNAAEGASDTDGADEVFVDEVNVRLIAPRSRVTKRSITNCGRLPALPFRDLTRGLYST